MRCKQRGKPTFEILERRTLLTAIFATLSSRGTLSIIGGANADVISVTAAGSNLRATLNGSSLDFPFASVRRLYISSQQGADTINVAVKLPSTIFAGDGDDTITVAGRSTIDGGNDNDSIQGSDFDDRIDGAAGDDSLNGEGGDDTLIGGLGADTAEYGDRSRGFNFLLSTWDAPSDLVDPWAVTVNAQDENGPSGPETDSLIDDFNTIGGTAFGDEFDVNDYRTPLIAVTLLGRAGNDSFVNNNQFAMPVIEDGGIGGDFFAAYGDIRETSMLGGSSNDVFQVGSEVGTINGGPGTDTITSDHAAQLDLRQAADVENCKGPFSSVIGSDGPNLIEITDDPDLTSGSTVLGNGGDDTIVGTSYGDVIFADDGNDVVNARSGNDKVHGGEGDDTIVGGKGHDRLYGDAGNDQILARDHLRDTLYGGDGEDQAAVDNATVKDLWAEIEQLIQLNP